MTRLGLSTSVLPTNWSWARSAGTEVPAPHQRQELRDDAVSEFGRPQESRRLPVLRGLLVGERDLDQRRLAPRAAEDRDADRQPADEPRGHGDVGVSRD